MEEMKIMTKSLKRIQTLYLKKATPSDERRSREGWAVWCVVGLRRGQAEAQAQAQASDHGRLNRGLIGRVEVRRGKYHRMKWPSIIL